MTDEQKQAALDALETIMKARQAGSGLPDGMPKQDIDLEIDPELDMPKSHDGTGADLDDFNIDDPDGLLKQQSDGQKQRSQSGGSSSGSSQNDDQNDDQSGEPGEEQGQGEGRQGDQNGQGDGKEGGQAELPPHYIRAWKKILKLYDNDDITPEDIRILLDKIHRGELTEI